MAIIKCQLCGKERYCRHSDIKIGKGKFCSLSCAKKHWHIKNKQIGSKNPNWKNGISKNNYHYRKLYILRYPLKIKAHRILHTAIRIGKIQRQPCIVCGKKNTHAHHENYSKPLDVIWMCKKHHDEYHNKKKRQQERLQSLYSINESIACK